MRYDDTCGAVGDGVGEDFAGVDEGAGERANSDDALGDEAIGAVKCQADEVFLLFVADIGKLFDCFFGRVNDRAVWHFKLPTPELKTSHNLRGFSWAETPNAQQIVIR